MEPENNTPDIIFYPTVINDNLEIKNMNTYYLAMNLGDCLFYFYFYFIKSLSILKNESR